MGIRVVLVEEREEEDEECRAERRTVTGEGPELVDMMKERRNQAAGFSMFYHGGDRKREGVLLEE